MRGRKPKPDELHALHGNPSKAPKKPADLKGEPVLDHPEPAGLNKHGRAKWAERIRAYRRLLLLTEIDLDRLAEYCRAWGEYRLAEEEIAKTGGLVTKTAAGNLVQNPWVAIRNKAAEQWMKIGAEFGDGPVNRARLGRAIQGRLADDTPGQPTTPTAADSFDNFLGSRPLPN